MLSKDFAPRIRRIIIDQSKRANVGHIGSALSVADIVAVMFGRVLRVASPDDEDRDRFILSKGHAALALYAALACKGWIPEQTLDTFCGDATHLGVHPEHGLPGVDFSTGSLGQGLSFGAGAALAAKLLHSTRRVFVLISDAECDEGSVWEAAMFAAHHKLSNLTVIIDCNGQQALGYTRDILDLSPLSAKWTAFGWHATGVDGHNEDAIEDAIRTYSGDQPHVLIAQTTFGRGVSFMEGLIKWHYWPMSNDEYVEALRNLGAVSK